MLIPEIGIGTNIGYIGGGLSMAADLGILVSPFCSTIDRLSLSICLSGDCVWASDFDGDPSISETSIRGLWPCSCFYLCGTLTSMFMSDIFCALKSF